MRNHSNNHPRFQAQRLRDEAQFFRIASIAQAKGGRLKWLTSGYPLIL